MRTAKFDHLKKQVVNFKFKERHLEAYVILKFKQRL